MSTPSLYIDPDMLKAGKLYSQLPPDGSGDFTVVRNTIANRTNASGLISSVAANVPRLDYPIDGGCPALLVEPAATNLLLRSEEFDDAAWVKTRTAITANATTAPNGTATADKIIANTDNNSHFVDQPITTPSGTAFTISFYAKASEYNFIQINNQVDNSIANFDLLNGVLGTISGYTASITNVGNGWYRCVATRTFSIAPTTHRIALITSASSARLESFVGDGTSGVFVWGAQAETGSVATSYIQTVATTQTRNTDVISLTGASALIGQTQGTLYAEVDVRNINQSASRSVVFLSDGTTSNRLRMQYQFVSGRHVLVCILTIAGVDIYAKAASIGTDVVNGRLKIAFAYASGNNEVYQNGAILAGTTSGAGTFAGLPNIGQINLGSDQSNTTTLNDHIRCAAIYKERLTNAELQALTTL